MIPSGKLQEIQRALALQHHHSDRFASLLQHGISPTLCRAMAALGINPDLLQSLPPSMHDLMVTVNLGLSAVHATLIRLADAAHPGGGLKYLDPDLPVLGVHGPVLARFWQHISSMPAFNWQSAAARLQALPLVNHEGWLEAASAAMQALPEQIDLLRQAIFASPLPIPAGEEGLCRRAAYRASIEIIAAGAGTSQPLQYLGLFGFPSLVALGRSVASPVGSEGDEEG